jgi:deoxyxylulose-5-phosphate synthase
LTDVRRKCLGLPSKFIEHGSQQLLRSKYRLDGEGIAQEVENFLERDSLTSNVIASKAWQLESVSALR